MSFMESTARQQNKKCITPEEVIRNKRRHVADCVDVRGFFLKLAAFLLLLYVLFGLVFGITAAENDGMSPKISAGDLVIYYRLAGSWSNKDVMVFEKEGQTCIGRIVARGGDTVEITDDAALKVNQSTVIENEIYYTTLKYEDAVSYPLTLETDEFFVLGDYRTGAKDSRYFGPIEKGDIKGKVITVLRRNNL